LGYNIYRTAEPQLPADAQPLNDTLIPIQFGVVGNHSYQSIDQGIAPDTTYFYWLQSVGVKGQAIIAGPDEFTLHLIHLPVVMR
jgi:hypothetical protein